MLANPQTTTDHRISPDAVAGPKELLRLRRGCRLALESYVDVASHGSGELGRLTPGHVDQLNRIKLPLLRQKEERAHEAYLDARAKLLEFVLAPEPA
jgi:hypothetical protein